METSVLHYTLRRTKYLCSVFSLCLCLNVFGQMHHDGLIYNGDVKLCEYNGDETAASGGIGFYQRFISRVRGSRCAMFPSCSNYGLMLFKNKPFVEAMVMTADRMIRCGHDGRFYDLTYEYGYPTLVDAPPFVKLPRSIIYKPKSFVTVGNIVPKNSSDSIVGFINKLINNHNYETALLEIERLEYFKPQLFDASLYCKKMLCYDGLDREEEGIFAYSMPGDSTFKEDIKVKLQIAKMYYEIGNYKEAIKMLEKCNDIDSLSIYKIKLYKSMSFLRFVDEEAAYHNMNEACRFIGDDMLRRNNLQVLQDLGVKKKKSPLMAGLMSIIPGAGYLYDCQPANALTSFLINGLLAYATYTSIKNKNYGIAGLTGVFSLTFYVGNITGAVNGAKRYNSRRISDSATMLERINNLY